MNVGCIHLRCILILKRRTPEIVGDILYIRILTLKFKIPPMSLLQLQIELFLYTVQTSVDEGTRRPFAPRRRKADTHTIGDGMGWVFRAAMGALKK